MKRNLLSLLVLISSLSAISSLAAGPVRVCNSAETDGVKWKYCIYTATSDQAPVLYYLHGGGDDETEWSYNPDLQKVRKVWEEHNLPTPMVISVSFGPIWLLAPKNASARSGLYELFVQKVMPYLEHHVLKMHIRRRQLLGVSMGGFNAAELYLRAPQLFERVAIPCPALMPLSPYADAEAIEAFIQKTGASARIVQQNIGIAQMYFSSPEAWAAGDPLTLADHVLHSDFPPLYVSCGESDGAGFYPGAKQFADLASARGVRTEWKSLVGGHCVMDSDGLALFLANP